MTAMFADDNAILATSSNQQTATENVQTSVNHISNWTRRWKININRGKSMHVNYTLRKTENLRISLDHTSIPQPNSAEYLGMHLDSRLEPKKTTHSRRNAQAVLASWKAFHTRPDKQTAFIYSYYQTDMDL